MRLEDTKNFDGSFRLKYAPYRDIINGLTKRQNIPTEEDIIYCTVSHDSSRILLVLQDNDEHYKVSQYDIESLKEKFTYDLEGEYIKAKEIV